MHGTHNCHVKSLMGCFQTGWLFVIECFAPDHKHNDWELTFPCLPALGSGTQLIRSADNHCAHPVTNATFIPFP